MKKIGIITVPYFENFGSVLQAFALKKYLEKYRQCKADIIPFQPEYQDYIYFQDLDLQKKYLKKQDLFNQFRKEYLNLLIKSIDESELSNFNYDYYITGSDQIWNPEITKFHPAYFLDFVKGNKVKIAYAASMALNPKKQTVNDKMFADLIPNLDYISIREKTHQNYLQQFTHKKVERVIDPTMLLNIEDYSEIISENSDMKEPYLLLYFLTHDSSAVDYGNVLAKKFGLKVIHYFADYPDRVFVNGSKNFAFAGPKEFLGYVKNASLVFTNSFHGTVFSILFERPFYTYTARRDMLSRVLDLTEMLGLEDRRFNSETDLGGLSLDVDFLKTKARIEIEREKAKHFLSEALL
ncbi:polysaccharide pyruvyl transferase family protein [Aminipila sp.]|uniref:polysaccharide pyruvyl transferase family protein n=1 Tax=Aminipila sp. TaxID=2060095 RepID=UPI002896DBBA|nr:polysaccharide pyruvyl transferase family protein [Aminipila sp.]